MKRIILPASVSSDLDWSEQICDMQGPVLIELDFGWNKAPLFINDSATFQSYVLALDQFSQAIWPRIKDSSIGVVLYRGSLSILGSLVVADGELDSIEAATVLGHYLHRLVSFLPDEAVPYCLFDDTASFSLGEVAQLLSQDRFLHVHLSMAPTQTSFGVLLPPDELCSSQLIHQLTKLLEDTPELRVIPERRLNELWDGLDELIVFEEALTAYGRRQLLGFEAAGGKIRSRGIRTPDPLLPKQMR